VRELLARVKAHIRSAQELARARDEAQSRAAIVDILHEVTDSLKPDEIYHILVRRVARVLQISKCSMVLAKPGDQLGVVVAAYENPMLRNLQIELVRYPEIQRALTTKSLGAGRRRGGGSAVPGRARAVGSASRSRCPPAQRWRCRSP